MKHTFTSHLLALLLLGTLTACAGFSIEHNPGDERSDMTDSEITASTMRTQWRELIEDSNPLQIAFLMKDLVDSTTASYIRYGQRVIVVEWRDASQQQGGQVPAAQIADAVRDWNRTQWPLLRAHRDNLGYAYRRVSETGYFGEDMLSAMRALMDHYDRVYDQVFEPTGSAAQYQQRLYDLESATETAARDYLATLRSYQ
jgi:hypothetical protein